MNQATVAQAMERAQLMETRAALRAEAVAEGLNNRRLAKLVRCSESMISAFFKADAHSKRVERRIRREIERRREKRLAKEAAKAGAA